MQRKLRMILDEPEALKEMGQRAVQFARENYDRHLRTERLYEIYDRAVRRRASVAEGVPPGPGSS
jgi:glycosyltransferase involved in cell wall biosynthesis